MANNTDDVVKLTIDTLATLHAKMEEEFNFAPKYLKNDRALGDMFANDQALKQFLTDVSGWFKVEITPDDLEDDTTIGDLCTVIVDKLLS